MHFGPKRHVCSLRQPHGRKHGDKRLRVLFQQLNYREPFPVLVLILEVYICKPMETVLVSKLILVYNYKCNHGENKDMFVVIGSQRVQNLARMKIHQNKNPNPGTNCIHS